MLRCRHRALSIRGHLHEDTVPVVGLDQLVVGVDHTVRRIFDHRVDVFFLRALRHFVVLIEVDHLLIILSGLVVLLQLEQIDICEEEVHVEGGRIFGKRAMNSL